MNTEKIKMQIMDALAVPMGVNTAKISVDVDWLIYFANRILEEVLAEDIAHTAPQCAKVSKLEPAVLPAPQISIKAKPVVQKVVQAAKSHEPVEPPPGAISHEEMVRIIKSMRELRTNKEMGQLCNVHPSLFHQVLSGSTPVSERVAKALGYTRHGAKGNFWFLKIEKQTEIKSKQKPESNSSDGLPRIVRTSPFEGAPRIIHRGPFQQLLDAQPMNGIQPQ